MDRFIDKPFLAYLLTFTFLKSNMDRFIDRCAVRANTTKHF